MKTIKLLNIIGTICIIFTSCKNDHVPNENTKVSTDNNTENIENIEISTVKIGGVEWTTCNLNTNKFQNGDLIFEAKNAEDWINAGKEERPAWCYYAFDSLNEKKYGKLYNWYAANDPKGLAPKGWHVATNGEWKELSQANQKKLRENSNIKYLDEIKFNPVSSGFCSSKGEFFPINKDDGQWWCYYDKKQRESYVWGIDSKNNTGWRVVKKRIGLPVRCVKDKY